MSDIYINGESLKVDKKFDSVVIEGFDEVMKSLKPKIVLAANSGGKNKFIISPDDMDDIYPIMGNKTFPDQYREYSVLPIYVCNQWGYDRNPKIVIDNNQKVFTQNNGSNTNLMFCAPLRSNKVNRLIIEMRGESWGGSYVQVFLNIASSPKITGIYQGNIDGTIYKTFSIMYRDSTVEELNNQPYIDFVTDDNRQFRNQTFNVDIAGLVRDGYITGDVFYVGFQNCDSGYWIRKIEIA